MQCVYEQWWNDGNSEFIVTPRSRSRLEDHVTVLIIKEEVRGHRTEGAGRQQQIYIKDTTLGENLEIVPLEV